MKIYIPHHLRDIGLLNQLANLIQSYATEYTVGEDSFKDYKYDLKTGPVKRFLTLCLPESEFIPSSDEDYGDVINYLHYLFYTAKGTIKVLEYMRDLLGLEFEGGILYTTRLIEFKLINVSLTDENYFYTCLEEFLGSLLYFQTIVANVDSVRLEISGVVDSEVGADGVTFNEQIAEII